MEQVVEDALQHGGPVEVPLPGHQDLRLVRVTCMSSVWSRVTCDVSRGAPSHLPSQELDWEATSANIKHQKFH